MTLWAGRAFTDYETNFGDCGVLRTGVLALALLVACVLANHSNDTRSLYNLAVVAHPLD